MAARTKPSANLVDRLAPPDTEIHAASAAGAASPPRGASDLVFLDLEEERRSRSNAIIAKRATQGLDIIHTGEFQEIPSAPAQPSTPVAPPAPEPALQDIPAPTPDVLETPAIEPALLDGLTRAGEFEHVDEQRSPLEGLDDVVIETDGMPAMTGSARVLDLEPTDLTASYGAPPAPPARPATPTPIAGPTQPEPPAE